jgi:hypothetical protein
MLSSKTRDTIRDCLELRRDELTGRLERYETPPPSADIVANVRDELAGVEAALAELRKT